MPSIKMTIKSKSIIKLLTTITQTTKRLDTIKDQESTSGIKIKIRPVVIKTIKRG